MKIVAPDAAGYLARDSYVTPSGRIVNVQPVGDATEKNELRIVLNWAEALKQQLARGK